MHASYILSALAAAGLASAACSASPTMTIENAADASALSGCQTFSGSIAIATSVSNEINIPVGSIDGDLVVQNNKGLSTLGADSLTSISGLFKLDNLIGLTTLSFPQLDTVGQIEWTTLTSLNGINLDAGISTADSIQITDTQLASFDGFTMKSVGSLVLQSNGVVKQLSLPLQKFSTQMTITANTQDNIDSPIALSLPDLQFGKNFNFEGLSSFSAPNLQGINGSYSISQSDVKTLEMSKLTTVTDTFTISKNSKLTEFSFPKLTTVSGGFNLGSCPEITKIDGLNQLATIGGALDFTGNFDDVALPSLKLVRGTFNIQSTGDIGAECKKFASMQGVNDVIRGGDFNCRSEDSTPENRNGQVSSGSEGGNGQGQCLSDDDSAASFILPSLLTVGAATAFSAMLGFF